MSQCSGPECEHSSHKVIHGGKATMKIDGQVHSLDLAMTKPPPEVHNDKAKNQEIKNQKFLIRMGARIERWKKDNPHRSLPIYKDTDGNLWWANREERKRITKRKKKEKANGKNNDNNRR